MASKTGTFSAQDQASGVILLRKGAKIAVTLTKTAENAIAVVLEEVIAGGNGYEAIATYTDDVSATETRNDSSRDRLVRIRAKTLSGQDTIAYTLADVASDEVVRDFSDSDGNVVLRITDAGVAVTGTLAASGAVALASTLDVTGTPTFPAGSIARSKLTADVAALAISVPVSALRHTTGVPLTAAETAGGFNVSLASHVHLAQAEITDNETEVSVCHAQVQLPPEYKAGGTITVRLPVAIVKVDAAVDNGSTIDLSVYKQASGAVGADLVTTAAQTFAAVDTWYNKDFVVTPTGLVAGDVLNLEITSSVIDSEAGGGTLRLNLGAPIVLVDVQG